MNHCLKQLLKSGKGGAKKTNRVSKIFDFVHYSLFLEGGREGGRVSGLCTNFHSYFFHYIFGGGGVLEIVPNSLFSLLLFGTLPYNTLPEFCWYFGQFFYLSHSQLLLNGKAMKKVSSKDKTVFWSVNSVNPATGDHQSIALVHYDLATLSHRVSEENISLFATQSPFFVQFQVVICGWYQPEDFLSSDYVIPDRGSSKVNMEVSVTSSY